MTPSLDTNVIMRYIWKDVPGLREKANELLDTPGMSFFVSDMVVSEVIFNLQSDHVRRNTIVAILNELAERKNIQMSSFVVNEVLPFFAEHPALSFVDCYTASEAKKRGREPLYTFDKKLAKQHKSAKLLA